MFVFKKVFQGAFRLLQDLYLLFQHHTTRERAEKDCEMFGEAGFSTIRYIDDGETVLLNLDTRSERHAFQIVR